MAKLVKEQRNLIERKQQEIESRGKVSRKPIEYEVTKEGYYRILQRASRPK